MTVFAVAPLAKKDLIGIWYYTYETWGVEKADAYVREVEAQFSKIARDTKLGRACQDLRGDYKKYIIRSHVIFYRVTPSGIVVVRILHQRMDFVRHLQ